MSFLTNPWPSAGSSNYVTETQDVIDEIDAGLADHESRITAVEGGGGGGGMTGFTVAADSGSSQSITNGNTLTIAGGTGIDSVASATDTVTLNIDATVATLTGSQTLTNKTLTAPAISSPTGLAKGDVGLGNVDNTSDATKNAAAVTLTNKTLTTPTIGSMANANHNHTNSAGGGQITDAALSSAVSVAKGGTGATTAAAARTNLGLPVADGPVVPNMESQVVYSTGMLMEGSSVTQPLTANQIYAIWWPWAVEQSVSFDQVSIYVASAAAAGKIARIMAFAPDGTRGKPSTLLKDWGTVPVDSTGIKNITSTLTPTNYGAGFWLAVVSDGTPTLYAKGNDAMQPMGTNSVAGTTIRGWEYALGSTTAPSPFSASSTLLTASYAPLIYLRRT